MFEDKVLQKDHMSIECPWPCSDIPYVFRNIDLVEYPHGAEVEPGLAERVEREAFDSVMAFACAGDPTNDFIPAWPACEPGKEAILLLDGKTRVRINHDHELMTSLTAWEEEIRRKMFAAAGEIQH